MPLYSEEQKRNIVKNAGYDPDLYDYNEANNSVFKKSVSASPQPVPSPEPLTNVSSTPVQQEFTPTQTAIKVGGRSALPALGGIVGGSLLAAPFTGGTSMLAPIIAGGIGALGGGYLTSLGQEKGLEAIQGEEEYKKNLAELEEARKQNPLTATAAEVAPMLLGARPSIGGIRNVLSGGGKLVRVLGGELAPIEKTALGQAAVGAGTGAATDIASQTLLEPSEQPYSPGRTLGAAALGATFTKPQLFGRLFSTHNEKVSPSNGQENGSPTSNIRPLTSVEFYDIENRGNKPIAQPWEAKNDKGKYLISDFQVDSALRSLLPSVREVNKYSPTKFSELTEVYRASQDVKRAILMNRQGRPEPDTPQFNKFEGGVERTSELDKLEAKAAEPKTTRAVGQPLNLPGPEEPPITPFYKQPQPLKSSLPNPKFSAPQKEPTKVPRVYEPGGPLKSAIDITSPTTKEQEFTKARLEEQRVKQQQMMEGQNKPLSPNQLRIIAPSLGKSLGASKIIVAPHEAPPTVPEVKLPAPEIELANKKMEDISTHHARVAGQIDGLVKSRTLEPAAADIIKEFLKTLPEERLKNFHVFSKERPKGTFIAEAYGNKETGAGTVRFQEGLADERIAGQKSPHETIREWWNSPRQNAVRTFFHEFAHVADLSGILTPHESAIVDQIYANLGKSLGPKSREFFRAGLSDNVESSKYYSKNRLEFLAESFAEYVMTDGKIVPHEKMRGLLGKLYDGFAAAVKRVLFRNNQSTDFAEIHKQMLPIYEKILGRGEGIPTPNKSTSIEVAKSPLSTKDILGAEPEVKPENFIERIKLFSSVSPTKFVEHFQRLDSSPLTVEAYKMGDIAKGNPELLAEIKASQAKARQEYDSLLASGNVKEAMNASYKHQFFREAVEKATNSGSAKDHGFNELGTEIPPTPPEAERITGTEVKFFPPLRSAIDTISQKLGESGKKGAAYLTSFYENFRAHEGKFVFPIIDELTKDINFFKNPLDWISSDNADNRVALKYMDEMYYNGRSDIQLSPRQTEISQKIRDYFNLVADEQIQRNIPVQDSDGNYRERGRNPDYMVQTTSNVVINELLNHAGSPKAKALERDFINFQIEAARLRGDSMEPARAQEILNAWKEAHSDSRGADIATQFGPIDKAEGIGIPESWREKNLVIRLQRYSRRTARRFAYYDSIENSPEARHIFGITHDVWGNKTENIPEITPIAGSDEVKSVLTNIRGQNTRQELKRDAAGGIIRSSMLGFGTGAVDFTANLTSGFAYFTPDQTVKSLAYAAKNFSRNLRESFQAGVNRINIGTLENTVSGANEVISAANRTRDVINAVQLRNLFEKVTRATAFGQGKFAVIDNISALSNGKDSTGQRARFMDNFGPKDWRVKLSSGQGLTSDEITKAAAKYVEAVQGSYDYRQLPTVAVEGSLAPFLSIARWNIGQANNFQKFVLAPAMRGQITPLLMSTVGMLIGGSAVVKLRELLSGRTDRVASVSELKAASEQGKDIKSAMFYKLASLADASGYAGQLGNFARIAGDVAFKNKPQLFTNPLLGAISNSFELIVDAVQAAQDGDMNISADILSKIIENYSQTYRIAIAQLAKNDVLPGMEERKADIERGNEARDYRVYNQLSGLPVNTPSADRPNIFAGKTEKRFKREENPLEARRILSQELLPDIVDKNRSNPELMRRKLRGLKNMPLTSMPSLEDEPRTFRDYMEYSALAGRDSGELVRNYLRRKALNSYKSNLVPSY